LTATLYATTELVTVAYLGVVLSAPSIVGLQLPGDQSSWAATGFVQVVAPHAGEPNQYEPIEAPVVAVRCWAVAPGGRRPPWNQAAQLAEKIRRLAFNEYTGAVTVMLPTGYEQAIVDTGSVLSHPARIGGDDSAFACYGLDVRLSWRGVGLG